MEAGIYLMKCVGHELSKSSKKGTEQLGILLEVIGNADGTPCLCMKQKIAAFLYFTPETYKRSVESLRILGWSSNDIIKGDGLGTEIAEVVVEMEMYESKPRPRVRWINRPGEGRTGLGKKVDGDVANMIASRIADLASTVAEPVGGLGPPQQSLLIGAAPDDGDIPFLWSRSSIVERVERCVRWPGPGRVGRPGLMAS